MFRLQATFPDLCDELGRLFLKLGEQRLASEVSALEIRDRCRCSDDFCATMFVRPRPRSGVEGQTGRTVDMESEDGYLIVDIVDDHIAEIEILYRDEVRSRLNELMPIV